MIEALTLFVILTAVLLAAHFKQEIVRLNIEIAHMKEEHDNEIAFLKDEHDFELRKLEEEIEEEAFDRGYESGRDSYTRGTRYDD